MSNYILTKTECRDAWLLVNPNHRIVHMFLGRNPKKSLCGINYNQGTYIPFHGKPIHHCKECENKYVNEKSNDES